MGAGEDAMGPFADEFFDQHAHVDLGVETSAVVEFRQCLAQLAVIAEPEDVEHRLLGS